MPINNLKNIFIPILLAFLCVSAFQTRLTNFKNSKARTIDEVVYVRLATQIVDGGLQQYTSIPYANELAAQGRDLPGYFFHPLFKHPPVFSLLIALSFKLFGINENAAAYIPILFSILMIPLIFLLGRMIFNAKIGLIAALILTFDPINIICSQKIWMESTLSFFILLSVTFFAYAIKSKKDIFFLLSGIGCGLAALTKYPSILTTFAFILYAMAVQRGLLKKPMFLLSLVLPIILMIPWFLFMRSSSQASFMDSLVRIHYKTPIFNGVPIIGIIGIALLIFFLWLFVIKEKTPELKKWPIDPVRFRKKFLIVISIIFGFALWPQFFHSWQITFLPYTTWRSGTFSGEPVTFYLGRLMEFGIIYIFAFLSFFLVNKEQKELADILRINTFVVLLFYIIWRNYQSRYILACLPFLILLGVDLLFRIYNQAGQLDNSFFRIITRSAVIIVGCLIFMKSQYININLSYTNNLCYF
ncbi:MAG: glycosyltransferase family 39 protein [Candidatus Omnitrophica bacterium]|nr:glycosyltransferase family 39 protein [Candidatus Omnitrophota bacterium]